jgi:hypothetical protein
MKTPQLAVADVPRLAAHSLADPRAILKLYAGAKSRRLLRARVERAARELGLPLPPPERTGGRP